MRLELYNCLQARWLPGVVNSVDEPASEEMMSIFNYTNHDIVYTLFDNGPVKSVFIYPLKCVPITRIKPNQYAMLSAYDADTKRVIIDRPAITNKLTTLRSSKMPYVYSDGMLGKIEHVWSKYLLGRSEHIYID